MSIAVSAVDWLLESDEPGIVAQAKRDLLDEQAPAEAARVLEGPKVRALLAGQQADGGFGTHVYAKWGGAHWRLVSLVELGVPAGEPRCLAAAETVLAWLTGKGHRDRIQVIDGLTRRCGSQHGNALAVAFELGLAGTTACPRARTVARGLTVAGRRLELRQEPKRVESSFMESLCRSGACTRTRDGRERARDAAHRAAECSLRRAVPPTRTPAIYSANHLNLHYPLFWHYDLLQAPLVLSGMGLLRPARRRSPRPARSATPPRRPLARRRVLVAEALVSNGSNVEIVDWRRGGPSEMLTLNALRVLHAAGRRRPRWPTLNARGWLLAGC